MKEYVPKDRAQLKRVAINNLPNKEFKVIVIKLLNELRRKMDEHSEKFNKELKIYKEEPKRAKEYCN